MGVWARPRGLAAATTLAAALAAGGATAAQATTICVPAYHPACPNAGGNVAEPDLEQALARDGSDGIADTVRVAAGTYVENNTFEPDPGSSNPQSFEPKGSDPLTVVGAGRAATVLTSPATSDNIFIVNLASNNSRAITLRELAIVVPASFDSDEGAALQLGGGDTLDRVDLLSRNEGGDGIPSAPGVNTVLGVEIRGDAGGFIGDGIDAAQGDSQLTVADSRVIGASWALQATAAGAQLTARRVDVIGARTYGAIATAGTITLENSRLTIDDGIGLHASSTGGGDSALFADHVSVLNVGDTYPAMQLKKPGGTGDVDVVVSNSILRGFSQGYEVNAAAGPGIGVATLAARYSNFADTGTSSGVTDLDQGNIDADPLYAAGLSLPAGSPSVDAGDPAAGLELDFLNAPRPIDGDGDGVARVDQGAFELQPPGPPDPGPGPGPDPGPEPDTTAPETEITKGPGARLMRGIAKFRFASSEPGSSFECKLDRKPTKRCGSPRRYGKLKPGRHRFRVWATDAAGNRDPAPAKSRFRVRR